MKKIITTLTAVTFALGLAAAAQAQMAKTPEKPAAPSTQAVQPQAAPKETAKTVTTETVTTGDKTQTVTQSGDKGKTKPVTKKVEPKCPVEKKAGAPMDKTQEGAK